MNLGVYLCLCNGVCYNELELYFVNNNVIRYFMIICHHVPYISLDRMLQLLIYIAIYEKKEGGMQHTHHPHFNAAKIHHMLMY